MRPSSSLKAAGEASTEASSSGKKGAHLDEFMQVMQPRTKKGRTWQNDVDTAPSPLNAVPVASAAIASPEVEMVDDEAGPAEVTEVDDVEWMKRRMAKGIRTAELASQKEFTQDEDDGMKGDVMESQPKVCSPYDVRMPVSDGVCQATVIEKFAEEPTLDQTRQTILQTGRLFLRNLAFSCTKSDLESLVSPFGAVAQVRLPFFSPMISGRGFFRWAELRDDKIHRDIRFSVASSIAMLITWVSIVEILSDSCLSLHVFTRFLETF